ncbi:MAG: NAD(P)-dependent oxidoreductase [Hyphomicrobiales bacterium]|nr:NAD(P)-dependent oxidoreductase [Hyphomicrobiales bacterium]
MSGSTMAAPRSVGLVGLGKMGRPMGRHLKAKGFAVSGCDPAAEARERAGALGVDILASPADVARAADLVIIVVGFDAEVERVVFGPDGILAAGRRGLMVAVASTIAPSYARRLAERVAGSGLVMLDMPLTRGEQAAEDGKLLVLGGGDAQAFEHCRPALASFASDVFWLGPFGAGQVAKMVNNMVLWACMAANDEGFRLAESLGLDPERLRAALVKSSAQNWSMSTRAEDKPVPWAEKDMSIVLREADLARISLPLAGCVKEVIKAFKIRRGIATPAGPD